MNLNEKAMLRTFLKLKDFFAMYAAILAAIPNLASYLGTFSSLLTSILSYVSLQSLDKAGAGEGKTTARLQLSRLIEDTSNRLNLYAFLSNNVNLMNEAKHTEKSLNRLSESQVYGAAQSMYDRAQANLAAVGQYGINASTQTALQTAINSFLAYIPKPEEAFFDKKQTSVKLEDLYRSEMGTLKKIDKFMRLLKYSQPAVYSAYWDARKVLEKGGRPLALKCRAIDSISKEGIKGCQFILLLVADSDNLKVSDREPITFKTAEKGGLYVRSLEVGTYEVRVVCTGYEEQKHTVVYTGNQMVLLEVEMLATNHNNIP